MRLNELMEAGLTGLNLVATFVQWRIAPGPVAAELADLEDE